MEVETTKQVRLFINAQHPWLAFFVVVVNRLGWKSSVTLTGVAAMVTAIGRIGS